MRESAVMDSQAEQPAVPPEPANELALHESIRWLLKPLASLKLTVVLFAMAIFIVFAGTLAQVDRDIWDAINSYFRTPVAWIELQIFFPASFFPSKPIVPGVFPFPGGWLIGLAMVINLLAAHGLRFKIQASGNRLIGGVLLIAVGGITTWLVVASGSNADGLQDESWIGWSTLWGLFKVGIGALWFAMIYTWLNFARRATDPQFDERDRWLLWFTKVGAVLLGILLGWLLYEGDSARLDDSGMRILWQLIKGLAAGLVLLAGCVLVFRKRAGIVLLHGGILLMMFSELLVGTMAEEGQMHIREGETVNYVQDIRETELAVIDRGDAELDDVVAVPGSWLVPGKLVDHEKLPAKFEVLKYYRNSVIEPAGDKENLADTGEGRTHVAVEARPGAGTDTGGNVDLASAYVRFNHKDGSNIGTYLLSAYLDDQPLTIDGKTYHVSLRFKRSYRPYQITLLDVRKDDYIGTDTPRNYSSDIRLVDAIRSVDREIKIWMNNPLRYSGETFYQSSYNMDSRTGVEMTGLQVVSNTGWMIPYVACMIVATGMLAHFSIALMRFLGRRAEDAARRAPPPAKTSKKSKRAEPAAVAGAPDHGAYQWLPVAIVALFALWLGSRARLPRAEADELNLYTFGKIPVVEQGRVKPIDTVARNTLRIISDRQTYRDENGVKQPAIRWLLDVVARPEVAVTHPVFRIDSNEVLDMFDLKRREGLRYSLEEIRPKAEEFNDQVEQARKLEARDLTLYQRKILDLDRRIRAFTLLQASFHAMPFPALPTEEEFKKDREATTQKLLRIREMLEASDRMDRMLASMRPPLVVPTEEDGEEKARKSWQPYSTAMADAYRSVIRGETPNARTVALNAIFDAYAKGDAQSFNGEVAGYLESMRRDPPTVEGAQSAVIDTAKVKFEAYFNFLQPFMNAAALYLVGFALACGAWLGYTNVLNRSAFWLLVFTLLVHTGALIARIYISGRPPVTNLYSSAVFIGWGGVLLGLILESIYRLGIGNVVAAVVGFKTLLISHFLAADGDTFTVLQAVLDTQFWLATHVVCITLGYATTFVAGLLGILYVVMGVCSPVLTPALGRTIARMTYGVTCFALFFSFVGTVLGGLWADDSWGRFWGWDPKENGALIIVLWNALVLHARWDGMVGDRGFAVLAIAGNIATSWSWFGVNELGVGLHSYGFTEGVLQALGLFVASQLALIALGTAPLARWWSYRRQVENASGSVAA